MFASLTYKLYVKKLAVSYMNQYVLINVRIEQFVQVYVRIMQVYSVNVKFIG